MTEGGVMITTKPAVQHSCKKVRRYVSVHASYKRVANRRHRRYLNDVTRSFINDPELFEDETFEAPTLTSWDLW